MELSALRGSLPPFVPHPRLPFVSSSSLLFSRPLHAASSDKPLALRSIPGLDRAGVRSIRTTATRDEDWSLTAIVSDDAASEPKKASLLMGSFTEEPPTPEKKVEEPPPASNGGGGGSDGGEETQAGEDLLSKLNLQMDSDNAYTILLYGSGALVALWISSALISSLDSVPLFPKVMEVVGLGFTVWFSSRYLIFKKNRDELFAKVEELKEQILGSSDG